MSEAAGSGLFQRFWQELPLPPGGTGRPVLSESEIECLKRDRVSLIDGRTDRVLCQGGVVTLTSHRIIWHSGTRALHGHLSQVINARKSFNLFKRSTRVHVFLLGQQDAQRSGAEAATKIDFVHGGRDEFLDQLRNVLQLREWEKLPITTAGVAAGGGASAPGTNNNPTSPDPIFTTRRAGVGGIIRQQEHTRAAQDKLAAEAFSDLQALMGKAREVVGVIERYATVLASKAAAGSAAGGQAGERQESTTTEDSELQGLLVDMGIANPVTRLSAGSLYHKELARQLAEFLTRGKGQNTLLASRGGMLTLHDAFCLFNRARGTELISPEDLLDACKLLDSLHLGMGLRRFPSGVNVIQAQDFSEERVSEKLRALAEAEADGSLTALDVATHLRISLTLAQEFLRTAERKGLLCRDESVQGTLFFPNRFPDFVKACTSKMG